MDTTTPNLFDHTALRKQRDRAGSTPEAPDFLLQAMAERLGDRLSDLTHSFPLVADIGCHNGVLGRYLAHHPRIGTLISCDMSARMLAHAPEPRLQMSHEILPFADNSLDAILSIGSLHWVNDLPGMLIQAQRALKPDGLLMLTLPGALTLHELRDSFAHAETQLTGGVRPRVAPFMEVRDAGGLLQRAGFALPVVDNELLTVTYADMFALAKDLRDMGETNVLTSRPKHFTSRSLFAHAAMHYAANYADEEQRLIATIELITLTAWKPADTQQKPLARGSAKHSLAHALQ